MSATIRVYDDGVEIKNASRVILLEEGFEVHETFPHRLLGGDEVERVKKRFIERGTVEVKYER